MGAFAISDADREIARIIMDLHVKTEIPKKDLGFF